MILNEAIQLFSDIFSSNDIIKIGWDFNKNDTKKLVSSGLRDPKTGKSNFMVYFILFYLI